MLKHSPTLDDVFHALSDPTRRAILDRLARAPATISELAEPMDMSLAAVVQHVEVLDRGGLIVSEKRGRVRTCKLEAKGLAQAEGWIAKRRADWSGRVGEAGVGKDGKKKP